jgi:hypothetical protein
MRNLDSRHRLIGCFPPEEYDLGTRRVVLSARFGERGPQGRISAEMGPEQIFFRKNITRAIVFSCALRTRSPMECAQPGRRRTPSATVTPGQPSLVRGQNVWNGSFGLEVLQPLETPQNRQRILWKSLEKTSVNLEKLGEKLGSGGGYYSRPTVDSRALLYRRLIVNSIRIRPWDRRAPA